MTIKKLIFGCLVAALALGGLAFPKSPAKAEAEEGIHVLTTIYPAYDWINCILGENPSQIQVTYLLENGSDLHSFQPSVEDMTKIASCDLFVYVGGESDVWVKNAINTTRSEDQLTLSLLAVLGEAALTEEVVEGMEAEEEEEEEEALDEHVWLSLRNASLCVDALKDALIGLDPANTSLYEANAAEYKAQLSQLDEAYQRTVDSAVFHTLLFGDRFPFRYLVEDYDLSYYAAFAGCSAENEASFETIIFLAQKVDELGIPYILTIETSDQKVAKTIQRSTKEGNQTILTLDSMQSAAAMDKGGYLSIMKDNLAVLKEALQAEV